ncbi:MAG TPA: EAL domain-containing protein [Sphingomicrobium sp.]|nr:EAL domain-containing protein [Sphingomicrobium sp.]
MITSSQRASDRLHKRQAPQRDLELEGAITADEIALRFQPQVEVASGRLVAVEALARWPLERCGERLFFRADAAGLGERLSRHAQSAAIAAAARWTGPLAHIGLALNCVAADLARPSYGGWLIGECSRFGLDPARLTIEITESSLVIDRVLAAAKLAWLRQWGVKIALDDFGTGYANLTYLTALPLDLLKIDRELIAGLNDERGRTVVQAVIAMALDLGLDVCAEGVETAEQMAMIADWGCTTAQGFLMAPALDLDELERFAA